MKRESQFFRRFAVILCLFSLICLTGYAQLTSSHLPIVIINPERAITDDIRTPASMKIIYKGPGQINYLSDAEDSACLDYNGQIDIELRGSSSQTTPKKQYGFPTRLNDKGSKNNVRLLGMPKENDWILNGMTFDPALMRDYLCYNLSRQIGEYASRTVYCEVIISGEYKGLYLLQEKIKPDDNRVDIVKLEPAVTTYPDLTGGYITKADKTTGDDPVAWTLYSWTNTPVNYIHEWPEPYYVNQYQNSYIRSVFLDLTSKAQDKNYSLTDGVPSIIDIPSFIDYMIISELSSNADAYMFSTFFHKDRNGKLRAGPVWDCDLTFGNDLYFWGFDRSKTDIWQFSNKDNDGSRFWYDLYDNPLFRCYLAKRWNELTRPGQPLHIASLESLIDQTASLIGTAIDRDRQKWGATNSYQNEIDEIKSFLHSRITWITNQLGSSDQCNNVDVPPLVITKIMYHPDSTELFPESDEQEFVEIFNNSSDVIDLTGVYFRGTGFIYQCRDNAIINPYSTLTIAANSSVFKDRYGSLPNDEFTRHLSNKCQTLLLADGFGNIIDSVRYCDSIPWPDADGNGYYLKLNDPGTDNSMAENWMASAERIVTGHQEINSPLVELYPNPVADILHIHSQFRVESISINDIQGRIIVNLDIDSDQFEVDMKSFHSGTYIIRLISRNFTESRKIIKQ